MTASQRQIRTDGACEDRDARALLFAANDVDDEIRRYLADAGWTIRLANTIQEVKDECASGNVNVALMQFEAFFRPNARAIQDLVQGAGRQVRWIALVQKASLKAPEVRSLIARVFYDFHTVPADVERLATTIGRAFGMAVFEQDRLRLGNLGSPQAAGMVGNCDAINKLRNSIEKAAIVDAPVLITGESGTGKELVAMSIHANSRRRAGPFVPVNCASIPGPLIQSEFFGYEKGAFTGAAKRTIGRIEAARGGTIFLDEIGDLAMDLQANLLRFLQQRTIQRVGAASEIAVDVRVVAATHANLLQGVQDGQFREDLYYRLRVIELKVPSLRERVEDIERLAQHFFTSFCSEKQPHIKGFSSDALQAMCRHDWPGNVRELINRVRHALIMSENVLISPADLDLQDPSERPSPVTLQEARAQAERRAIEQTLPLARNNLSLAARILGVSRGTLYRLMEKHQLPLHSAKPEEA